MNRLIGGVVVCLIVVLLATAAVWFLLVFAILVLFGGDIDGRGPTSSEKLLAIFVIAATGRAVILGACLVVLRLWRTQLRG
jgi:hypothetical protein